MAKEYLVEQFTVDCATDVKKRDDLFESLDNGKIKGEIFVEKNGKRVAESAEFEVLGVYDVPISRPGLKNKNNRTYTLERSWNPVLEKKMGEGSIGLLNHPKQGEAPDVTKSCCVWRNHRVATNEDGQDIIRADMFILKDKKGNGDLVESIIKAGGKVDLSTRGYGEIDPQGVVYNYDYKATDVVYEGSYGVQASKEHRYSEEEEPRVEENSGDNTDKNKPNINEGKGGKKGPKMEAQTTNNKVPEGDYKMNKVIVKRLISESLSKDNKFKAFIELSELGESIQGDEELKDQYKVIQEEIKKIQPLLEQEYQGDAKDNGSADKNNKGLDPEKKIKDTDEKEPDDVKSIEVDSTKDTPDSERTGKTGIKAASTPESMKAEVESGEISSSSQGTRANEGAEVEEDTDEEEPDDVDSIEVEKIDDTKKRTAYTDTKAGSGKKAEKKEKEKATQEIEKLENLDLSKLNKQELVDVITNLNEATKELQGQFQHEQKLFDKLSEQYLKLETYTLKNEAYTEKAEQMVEADKVNKEKAQSEVTEAVAYVKDTKEKYDELLERVKGQQAYIRELEEIVHGVVTEDNEKEDVEPYVQECLNLNPQLAAFEDELLTSNSVEEVNERIKKYSGMGKKVRIDRVLTEDYNNDENPKETLSEGQQMLKNKNWI